MKSLGMKLFYNLTNIYDKQKISIKNNMLKKTL